MQPLGLERGQRGSKAQHTDVKKYYTVVNEFCEGGGISVIAGLQAENAKLKQRLLEVTNEHDDVVAGLEAENAKLEQRLSTVTAITPITKQPKTSSTISNRHLNRSLINDGDPFNHIRNLLENNPSSGSSFSDLSTSTSPEVKKVEVVTPLPAVTLPEIELSSRVTEIKKEEAQKISPRPSAKSRDRGGR